MKKVFLFLIALCLILGSGPGVLAAEPRGPAAEFTLTKESGDIYWLTLSAKDTTFNVFQFALNFDPNELVLVDKSGKETDDPAEYQEDLSGGWLSQIGCETDNGKGYFTFCGYIMPGQKPEAPLNEDGSRVVADSKGVPLFRFRFKKLGKITTGFSVATDKTGLAYNEAFPQGAAFIDGGANHSELKVRFQYPKGEGKGREETIAPEEAEVSLTRAERVKGTLAFQLGNSFAVVEGKRKVLYPGETVSPYEESGVLYLPLRFAAESLGAKVTWNGAGKPILVESDGRKAEIALGNKEFTLNGKEFTASSAALLQNSRTMVPVDLLEAILDLKYTSTNGLNILAPASTPWNEENAVEQELTADMNLLLSPLVGAATKGG